ncbi:hypothetical protein O181_128310 [Austropuccinia psidii MF-1]|uniref:Uncharacterized protein n=1 Tax=Austropuccinia psidii MF-1 TaxID=1389203 RepID=A0A9Q3KZY3_9BASI|nr:hypothetical protein [Austropuccinia psidii MF-1]
MGERNLHSNSNTSALNTLKEISLKNKITINEDLKPQENPIIQEESMESTSKPKQNKELNEILENIMDNQPKNGNHYGQQTAKKESRKPNIKNSGDKDKSLLPQEVTIPPIFFSKILQAKASHKQDNNFQPFPPNMKSKIGIGKSELEFSKELIQEPKEESDTYLPKENNLFHIHTPNKDPIFLQYPQHFKAFHPSRELNKEIQPENKASKKVVTAEKESKITKNEDLNNSRPKDSTDTRNPMEQYLMENKSDSNEIYRSNYINHSTNAKEEDSPTPYHHSNKENNNFNLE